MTDKPVVADESIAGRRSDNVFDLPEDMLGRHVAAWIDWLNLWVGKTVAWLVIPLIAAMTYEIFMRKFFTAPTVWAFDVSRMLYGAMFVLGSAYGLSKGIHIRSDFLYRNWSVRTQGTVDTVLYLFLFIPSMVVFLWVAGNWAWEAVDRGERGMDSAWMPLLGPIKMCLPFGVFFLLLQGISEILKSWYAATKGRWPNAVEDDFEEFEEEERRLKAQKAAKRAARRDKG